MPSKTLVAATAAAVLSVAAQAWARSADPLVPTALVEDVKSATADVDFMDYVGIGQVIRLAPGDVLVLSYLKSCEREIITGGTVIAGAERSDVQGGRIVRNKAPCAGNTIQLSRQEASQSGATAFRLQSAESRSTLYGRTPLVRLPGNLAGDGRTLVIARTDRPGERYELPIDDVVARAGFYDLAKANVSLTRGAIYDAGIGGHRTTFQIDAKAKSELKPVISRLLQFK